MNRSIQQNRSILEARFPVQGITVNRPVQITTNRDHCFIIQKQLNEVASGVKSKSRFKKYYTTQHNTDHLLSNVHPTGVLIGLHLVALFLSLITSADTAGTKIIRTCQQLYKELTDTNGTTLLKDNLQAYDVRTEYMVMAAASFYSSAKGPEDYYTQFGCWLPRAKGAYATCLCVITGI